MSLLISVAKLLKRYSIIESTEVNSLAVSAIQSTTLQLEGIIRTSFARSTTADQYWVNSNERPFTGEFPKLLLKNGFIDDTATYEVKTATELDLLSGQTAINAKYLKRDDEKGLLIITGTDIISPPITPFVISDRSFVQIDYTYGFTTTTTEFGEVYDSIPVWLEELALQISFWVYRELLNCGSKHSKSFKVPSMSSILDSHIRFFPSALPALI